MIKIEEYFTNPTSGAVKPHRPEHDDAATDLLSKVNRMLESIGWAWLVDPDTKTSISGERNGAGDGGFRLSMAKTGAPNSMHKQAHAVDVFDPLNVLDLHLTDALLEEFGLYREHPEATNGWCHLQDLPPHSGMRTYHP